MTMPAHAETLDHAGPKNLGPVGDIVRALRLHRGMTLDALADLTEISKGHLSRFERGEKSVSVAALVRIATALNTSVSALLGEKPHDDTVHVVRANDTAHRWKAEEGYEYLSLAPAGGTQGPETFKVKLSSDAIVAQHAYHSGEEALLVLKGAVEISFPSHKLSLAAGDYAQFPGFTQHSIRGLEDDTELFVVIIPRES